VVTVFGCLGLAGVGTGAENAGRIDVIIHRSAEHLMKELQFAPKGLQHAVARIRVELHRAGKLFQVRRAARRMRPRPRLVECGQQHRGENRNDCDHNQKFDQREVTVFHSANLLSVMGIRSRLLQTSSYSPATGRTEAPRWNRFG